MSSDDQTLLARIAQRDDEALGLLYDRYGRLVYTIAMRITASATTAEEVAQDVFYNVWRDAHSFRPQSGSVSSWLMSIARHRAIDATRSRRYRAGQREAPIADEPLPSLSGNPEQEVDERLLRQEIQEALRTLPEPQRRAIELAYYGGLTRSEIAEQLGEPLGTIKTRLRLGMTRLRDLLRRVGEGAESS